jgi:hypothetical protein
MAGLMVVTRNFRRRALVVTMVMALAVGSVACDMSRAGAACRGSGFARDNGGWILQCKQGRYRRVMTIARYLQILKAVQDANAAESGRAQVFRGLGTWVDVYDWSPSWVAFKNPGSSPPFTLARIDRMADAGVQVLYLQTAKTPLADPLDADVARAIVNRAHSRGMRVVAWYLPTHADNGVDVAHLDYSLSLGVDGIGLDIEDRSTVPDVGLRNQRLVDLVRWFRGVHPYTPFAAIVLPPVVTDVINPAFWPQFPWLGIRDSFDAWMPMSYWSNRLPSSGYREGYRYTAENIDRLRVWLQEPNAVVHPVGGIANDITLADIDGFLRAGAERGAIGFSLYDDGVGTVDQYLRMAPARRP